MKKLIALLLAAAMLLSLCACGSPKVPEELEGISDEDWEAAAEALEDMYEEEPVTETEPAEKIYQLGDTALTPDGLFEVTLDNAYFTDRMNRRTCAPAAEGEGDAYLDVAAEGKTYLVVTGVFHFAGNIKESFTLGAYAKAEYDGIVFQCDGVTYAKEDGEISNYIILEPLMEYEPWEFRAYFEVPKAVENDSEGQLLVDVHEVSGHEGIATSVFQVR